MEAVLEQLHDEIVQRCRDGDSKAQYQLYQLYAKPMLNVSMRIVNNTYDAEDILQEAFVDMYRKLHTFRGESTFGAWFKRIVVNKSINAIKKKRLITTDLENETDEVKEETSEEVSFPYSVQQVQDAIEQLPAGYRAVFSLFLFEGWSHKEIARELNISESTSKSQYNRAKKKIREILKSR